MILVTGGTGMLGAHLLLHLCQTHKHIRAIKRADASTALTERIFAYYHGQPQQLMQHIEWVEADITDYLSLEAALGGVHYVYHCAALVSFKQRDTALMQHVNAYGTRQLVDACLGQGVKKLLYVSSIAALGRANSQGLVDEDSPWKESRSNSPYAQSKHAAEMEVWRGMAEGLSAVIVNPSVILGAGDWTRGSAELFSFVYKGLKYYTTGVNGYVYVQDVCRIMIQLMQSPITGERFVVNAENMSYQALFAAIADALGKPAPQRELTARIIHIGRYLHAIKDMAQGKRPRISKQMAKNAVSHYRYNNGKLLQYLDVSYTSIAQAAIEIAQHYEKG